MRIKNKYQNKYQKVRFEKKYNPIGIYEGIILSEDHESCVIGVDFEGTEATIVCYYDEWTIFKL